MKKLFSLLLISSLFSLTGCLEIVRNITINENGTGSLDTKIDLGEVFEMVKAMGQEQQLEQAREKQIDTLIQVKDLAAKADKLTAEEKQLLSAGNIRININVDSGFFYTQSSIPFNNLADIEKINILSQRFLNTTMDKALDEGKGEATEEDKESLLGATFDEYYITTYTKNSIKKRLDKTKENPFTNAKDETTKAMQEMSAMGMEVKSTIVYHLPRPAKKIEGKNAVLSADKKQVTITSTFSDISTDPTALEFKISF